MSKTSSTSSGETKQDDAQLHFLGAKLIPSATTKEELISTDLVFCGVFVVDVMCVYFFGQTYILG